MEHRWQFTQQQRNFDVSPLHADVLDDGRQGGQGYYYGRPMPAGELLEVYRNTFPWLMGYGPQAGAVRRGAHGGEVMIHPCRNMPDREAVCAERSSAARNPPDPRSGFGIARLPGRLFPGSCRGIRH